MQARRGFLTQAICAAVAIAFAVTSTASAAQSKTSTPFTGVKANTGTVSLNGRVLTLSDDFKAPDAPDPHWQVVDSKGRIYLLQKLSIKGNKMNRKITVPKYVPDIAKVQFWCAFAEVNLGEAAFEHA